MTTEAYRDGMDRLVRILKGIGEAGYGDSIKAGRAAAKLLLDNGVWSDGLCKVVAAQMKSPAIETTIALGSARLLASEPRLITSCETYKEVALGMVNMLWNLPVQQRQTFHDGLLFVSPCLCFFNSHGVCGDSVREIISCIQGLKAKEGHQSRRVDDLDMVRRHVERLRDGDPVGQHTPEGCYQPS